MMRRLALAALLCSLCAAADAAAETRWTVVRGATLTVLGDQPVSRLREVAEELEQFRRVLGRLSAGGEPAATAPTLVYVFGTRKAFEQFVPLRNGKPISVGGYFQRGIDTNTIALSTDAFTESAAVVFHEYTHLLLGSSMRAVPVWLNEGLAEYYSTYRLRAGGRGADIGLPIARHVELLRKRFMPLSDLLAVDHSSDLYNEGERRSIFYAESWALTHYLLTELPDGAARVNQFAAAIAGGARPDAAFTSAFGTTPAGFEPTLRAYVRNMTFKSWIFTFRERLQPEATRPSRTMPSAEAEAWLGDLQLRITRTEEATGRIEAAVAAGPDNAAAQLVLGRLRLSQSRFDETRAAVSRAAQLAPDDFEIQYGAGVAALLDAEATSGDGRDALVQLSRDTLSKAAAIDAGSPDAFAWLAYAQLEQRDWNEAARSIARAILLAPGRIEFRLRQADITILRGTPAAARPMLQEIATRSIDPIAVEGALRRLKALDAAGVKRD